MSSVESTQELTCEETSTNDKYLFQYFVAVSATLMQLCCGTIIGWAMFSLPLHFDKSSPIFLTNSQATWLGASILFSSLAATMPSSWMMDKYGRKITLLVGIIPMIIGWIILGIANSVTMLFIGRIITGTTFGFGFSVLPMYLGEIASDRIRGSMTSILIVMTQIGSLYVLSIGPFVAVNTMAWIALIPAILFAITFIWCPESPYYLLCIGRRDEARKCLTRLRGHCNVDAELDRIESVVKRSKENRGKVREILSKEHRKSVIIILTLAGMQNLCGGRIMLDYGRLILHQAVTTTNLTENQSNIAQTVVQITSSLIGVIFIDIWGRRPLLLVGAFGTAICSSVMGIFIFLSRDHDLSNVDWLPLVLIMIYLVCYCIGMLTVPFTILSEIFVNYLKATAAGMASAFGVVVAIIIIYVFEVLSADSASYISFWIFASCSLLFIPFVWWFIPETKGKSLENILNDLSTNGGKDSTRTITYNVRL